MQQSVAQLCLAHKIMAQRSQIQFSPQKQKSLPQKVETQWEIQLPLIILFPPHSIRLFNMENGIQSFHLECNLLPNGTWLIASEWSKHLFKEYILG